MITKIEAARLLVMFMEPENEADKALQVAVLTLLEEQPKPEPPAKPEPKKTKNHRKSNAKPFDLGKAQACREAGWTLQKIADELGVSVQTVSAKLREAKKNELTTVPDLEATEV